MNIGEILILQSLSLLPFIPVVIGEVMAGATASRKGDVYGARLTFSLRPNTGKGFLGSLLAKVRGALAYRRANRLC